MKNGIKLGASNLLGIIDWNPGEEDKMNLMVKAFEQHLGGPRDAIYFIIDAILSKSTILDFKGAYPQNNQASNVTFSYANVLGLNVESNESVAISKQD